MTRVLVLEGSSHIALSACRALGRAGYEVGVTGSRRREPAGVSRFCARYHRLPLVEGNAGAYADALQETVARFGYDVVVATRDPAVARLAGLELTVPSSPGWHNAYDGLVDKLALAALCATVQVPYPGTHRVASDADVERSLAALRFPVVVKSSRSALATAERVVYLKGARVVRDAGAAERAVDAIRAAGGVPLVQEWIAGDKFHAVLIRRSGQTTFRYAHRYVRELDGGSEVALETMSADTGAGGAAIAMLERLLDASGYDGFVQAEFFEPPADGGPVILFDVNARLWGSVEFPEKLGLRVVERVVRDAVGAVPLPDAVYRDGRRYHSVTGEIRYLQRHRAATRAVLRTTRPGDVFDHPSLTDPAPFALVVLRKLHALLERAKGRR